MVTQAPDAAAIKEFAEAIGEWLLTQRFGQITPLAYRHRIWEPRPDDRAAGERPHVVIELVVSDPPPPPPEWHRLNEKERLTTEEFHEWARGQIWPREDRWAVEKAATEHALKLGLPVGIEHAWPVSVHLFGRSEASECGFPRFDD